MLSNAQLSDDELDLSILWESEKAPTIDELTTKNESEDKKQKTTEKESNGAKMHNAFQNVTVKQETNNYLENGKNGRRHQTFGDEEDFDGQFLLKVERERGKRQKVPLETSDYVVTVESKPLDLSKIDRTLDNFGAYQKKRTQITNDLLRQIAVLENANPNNEAKVWFRRLRMQTLANANAVDTAMIGIEISLIPFKNLWQNGKSLLLESNEYLSQKLREMVKVLVQMKEDISIVMKQWIREMKRQMVANGGAKYDTSVDNLLNIVESLVDIIEAKHKNVSRHRQISNLTFSVAFFRQMIGHCSPPLNLENTPIRSKRLQIICEAIRHFCNSAIYELSQFLRLYGR
ncbi:hypothetical protein niasHS_007666 [Heterodera schachtii]|uniref:Uncharacterized protein n=1 Tax=Heterodera schachtii TaxID=97005 RepID=A0ABD2JPC4_HETSC